METKLKFQKSKSESKYLKFYRIKIYYIEKENILTGIAFSCDFDYPHFGLDFWKEYPDKNDGSCISIYYTEDQEKAMKMLIDLSKQVGLSIRKVEDD